MQNWGKCNYSKQCIINVYYIKNTKIDFKNTKNPLMINDHNLQKTSLADNIYKTFKQILGSTFELVRNTK